jgi:hypothetical protein
MSDETAEQLPPSDAEEVKQAKSKPSKQAKQAKQAKSKQVKDKKAGKPTHKKPMGKKARGADATADAEPSVAGHPRAGKHVRQARGWGGLGAFAIAAYLSMHAGVPPFEIGIRALVAGAAGYLLAWACSVTVWRHLVVAELRVAAERGRSEHPQSPRGGDGRTRDTERK